jgi:hypothetical protein
MCITAAVKRHQESKALRDNGVAACAATRHETPHPSLANARFAAPRMNGIRFADMHVVGRRHLSPPLQGLHKRKDRKGAWRDGTCGTSTAPRCPRLARGWAGIGLERDVHARVGLFGQSRDPFSPERITELPFRARSRTCKGEMPPIFSLESQTVAGRLSSGSFKAPTSAAIPQTCKSMFGELRDSIPSKFAFLPTSALLSARD